MIGTLARARRESGVDVVIVSSDKDMLQLVDDHVQMLNPMKDDKWYDAADDREVHGRQAGSGRRSSRPQGRHGG